MFVYLVALWASICGQFYLLILFLVLDSLFFHTGFLSFKFSSRHNEFKTACQKAFLRLEDDKSTLSVDYALIYSIDICIYIYFTLQFYFSFIEVQSCGSQVYMQWLSVLKAIARFYSHHKVLAAPYAVRYILVAFFPSFFLPSLTMIAFPLLSWFLLYTKVSQLHVYLYRTSWAVLAHFHLSRSSQITELEHPEPCISSCFPLAI